MEKNEGVSVKEFMGLVTRRDRHDLPPGAAQEQTNVGSAVESQLDVRQGYRPVVFESEDA